MEKNLVIKIIKDRLNKLKSDLSLEEKVKLQKSNSERKIESLKFAIKELETIMHKFNKINN